MNDPRAVRVGKEEERAPRRRPEAARAGERGRLMVTSQKTLSPSLEILSFKLKPAISSPREES